MKAGINEISAYEDILKEQGFHFHEISEYLDANVLSLYMGFHSHCDSCTAEMVARCTAEMVARYTNTSIRLGQKLMGWNCGDVHQFFSWFHFSFIPGVTNVGLSKQESTYSGRS